MPTLYLTEQYAIVRRDSEDCLLVQIPEKKDEHGATQAALKKRIPLVKVEDVVVMGEITMTASALHLLLERNIEIHFLSQYGKFKGKLSPGLAKNSLLRLAQHRAHTAMGQRCELARRFALGKLANQRTLLRRHQRRQPEDALEQGIAAMTNAISTLLDLSCQIPPDTVLPVLASGDSGIAGTPLETILGLEGNGSAAYFGAFGLLLSDTELWSFPGRFKRPPTDAINALLSFGYALLASQVSGAIQVAGFDPYIGYLHSSVYGRPALALDMMEEFRPIIVDAVVLGLLNNRMLKPEDFSQELDAFRLKDGPRKLFLTRFEERLNEEITHPVFAYKVTYRRCIEMQARLLAKYLTGEIDVYPPLVIR